MGGRRRRFAMRTAERRRWERLRLEILARDGYRCRSCGRAGRLEVDHITPISKGGDPWDPGNLQVLCRSPCHMAKSRAERTRPEHPEIAAWRAYLRGDLV